MTRDFLRLTMLDLVSTPDIEPVLPIAIIPLDIWNSEIKAPKRTDRRRHT